MHIGEFSRSATIFFHTDEESRLFSHFTWPFEETVVFANNRENISIPQMEPDVRLSLHTLFFFVISYMKHTFPLISRYFIIFGYVLSNIQSNLTFKSHETPRERDQSLTLRLYLNTFPHEIRKMLSRITRDYLPGYIFTDTSTRARVRSTQCQCRVNVENCQRESVLYVNNTSARFPLVHIVAIMLTC